MTTGQRIVAHHRWGVRGLGQRTKNGIRNRTRLRLVFHRVKKTLQVVPCRFFRNVHPGISSRNTQLLHISPTGIRVRPTQDGHFELGEQSTDCFIGLDHKHFNQRVGEGVVFRHRIDDTTVFGKHQINVGEIQVNHAVATAAVLDDLGQPIRHAKGLNQFIGILRGGTGKTLGGFQITIDDGLGLAVRKPFGRTDDGRREPLAQNFALVVERDEHTLGHTLNARLQ